MGDGVDEGAWMGKRVGIRYDSLLEATTRTLVIEIVPANYRWLYSSCMECEICERNNTACPYQKNAGAVCCFTLWSRLAVN